MASSKGFTITELLTALAILAVVLSVSLARLPDLSRQQRLCRETRRLQLLLNRTRARSLAFATPFTVAFRSDAVEVRDPTGTSLEKLPLLPGIRVKTTSNIKGELAFYPSHTATPATLTISLGSLAATLVVSLRGRTRVQC